MERKHPERLPYTIVQEPRLGTSLGSASGYLASRLGSPGSGGLAALTSMAGLGGNICNISSSQSGGSSSQGQDQNSTASSTNGQGTSLMTMSNSSPSGKALAALTSRLPAVAAALLPMSQ